MANPIAIFFHGLFFIGEPPRCILNAADIISDQITQMINSGLWNAASEIHFGINGGQESALFSQYIIPEKAKVTYHGLRSRSENPTILLLENWTKTHPGWNILYLHSKGATVEVDSDIRSKYTESFVWRAGMMKDLVSDWQHCVSYLDRGYDIVSSLWLWNQADGSQHIPAGNFLWVKSDFVRELPSILKRDRIRMSGLESLESRYEAEVFWGTGRRPAVKSFRSNKWYCSEKQITVGHANIP